MKPLIRRMGLTDDDPVGRELRLGRTLAYQSLLDAIKDDETLAAKLMRKEYGAVVELNGSQEAGTSSVDDVIGDDAYRVLVQELDWAELSADGGRLA